MARGRMRRRGFELVLVGLVIAMGAVAWDLSYVLAEAAPHSHDEPHGDAIVMAHNTAATVVVVLGVVLAVLGARMFLRERAAAAREGYFLLAATSLLLADGVLHFYAVGDHLAIVPFAVFFVASGAALIVLGLGVLRANPLASWLSVLVTLGLIALFFATRVVAPPFLDRPEPLETLGLLSKALEVAALVVLGVLLYRWRTAVRSAVPPPAAP